MKNDTQHLEFLISQYVDGTLDAASRKSIEQQLLTDETAREIYQEMHETQEVLDDWGSRLPMINWGEFDAKLAERLEKESPATVPVWRKWLKPAAIAASLLVAVGTGYFMRSMQGGGEQVVVVQAPPVRIAPAKEVTLERPENSKVAGRMSVDYSANLPPVTARPAPVMVSGDPLKVIEAAANEGSDDRWLLNRAGRSAMGLPQTQPGAVQAGRAGRGGDDESVFR